MLTLEDMQNMQKELYDKHKGEWAPFSPEGGRTSLLWMMEEFGEVVSILKKLGEGQIMENPAVRRAFTEEIADTMMFLNDALLCYGITPEELSGVYETKHRKNMGRDWNEERKSYIGRVSGK